MRIRSVLAATVLGIALAAVGATTATADEAPRPHHHFRVVCSPYIGAIDTVSADIFWAGKHCDRF
ncbi:hypothetical protein GCM10010269_76770 [Streptomyces humidus]|uniref:Uncharacterized protein n=1 Tax=Streptomyces humidus TaxID=52259 RepID=A0A918LBE1_9ACTN|nr:hypothetical protein [Streptomyces humidus]GGS26798.1 hypothetical protein GCM10010269_76770 [Streptomyces humidus]